MGKWRYQFAKIFLYLPEPLSSWPYKVLSKILKIYLQFDQPNLKATFRNSTQLGYCVLFSSDLDISLIGAQNDLARGKNTLVKFKKFIPLIGEINFYDKLELNYLKDIMNPWELRRDPDLAMYLGKIPELDMQSSDRLVYLIRMLEADWHRLKFNPQTSYRKWKFHLGLDRTPSEALVLQTVLSQFYIENQFNDIFSFLNHWDENKSISGLEKFVENPWVRALFLHRCCFLQAKAPLNDFQKEILLSSAKWELWAMKTQFLNLNMQSVKSHLENIKRNVQHFACEERMKCFDRVIS